MDKINIQYYKTKIGELILGSFNNDLYLLDFRYRKMRIAIDSRIQKGLEADFIERNNQLLERTRQQIDEYFSGNRKKFTIPLLLVGSSFQKNVWKLLLKVPYGTTSTYLQLAKNINNKKAVRSFRIGQ